MKKQVEKWEDLLPLTYFIRKGGLCYIESSSDAKRSGVHIATAANETYADMIVSAISKQFPELDKKTT